MPINSYVIFLLNGSRFIVWGHTVIWAVIYAINKQPTAQSAKNVDNYQHPFAIGMLLATIN